MAQGHCLSPVRPDSAAGPGRAAGRGRSSVPVAGDAHMTAGARACRFGRRRCHPPRNVAAERAGATAYSCGSDGSDGVASAARALPSLFRGRHSGPGAAGGQLPRLERGQTADRLLYANEAGRARSGTLRAGMRHVSLTPITTHAGTVSPSTYGRHPLHPRWRAPSLLIGWLCNPARGVSAHYLVAADGTVTAMVE